MVVAIGDKIKASDSAKTYGYIAYKLRDDDTLEALPKSFVHQWGLAYQGTFKGKFWPPFKRNGSTIVGSAYNRKQRTLYILVKEINKNVIYVRDLDYNKGWQQWTTFASDRLNSLFTIKGNVYVVDTNSIIKSYRMKSNGLIEKQTIVTLFA